MPKPGYCWRHVIISTHCSWLPGDPRGFRTRRHKLHSSGDYKNRPPKGEHANIFQHSKEISGEAVIIPNGSRQKVGLSLRDKFRELGCRILIVSVSATHCHLLAELPIDLAETRAIVGKCKGAASMAISDVLPGRVWAHGGKFKIVDTPAYQKRVFNYILNQEDAWTWSFRDDATTDEQS